MLQETDSGADGRARHDPGVPDFALVIALVFLTWWSFHLSPVDQIYDSRYSLLLAEQIYRHGSFELGSYLPSDPQEAERLQAQPVNLEKVGDGLYFFPPPGASLLSIPFTATFNRLGWSAADEQGRYDYQGERFMQRQIAALLMALLAGMVFWTSRRCLTMFWSLATALAFTFGSPIWSTLSRGLWSHTWGVFLLSASIWLMLATGRRWSRPRWLLLATLLSWCFFVRPTFSISILCIVVWVFWESFEERKWLVLAGVFWLAGFAAYSQLLYGMPLPAYYLAGRLGTGHWAEGMLGNLISPSRGLFVFMPGLLFVAYTVWIGRRDLFRRPLFNLALLCCFFHWIVVSAFPKWWGGHAYGPRLMVDVLPWLILISVLSTACWLSRRRLRSRRFRWEAALMALLWVSAALMHSQGAFSQKTLTWHVQPADVDSHPQRLWDWSDPQFLAAFRN